MKSNVLFKNTFIIVMFLFQFLLPSLNAENVCKNGNGIMKARYETNEVLIVYPQIVDLEDLEKQKKINNLIKHDALEILERYKTSKSKLYMEIEFKAYLFKGFLLSIQYSGYSLVEGSTHPVNLFYSTNINLENCGELQLRDLISINENFISLVKSGRFRVMNSEPEPQLQAEINRWLNKNSSESLMTQFLSADSMNLKENKSGIFSYLTEDSLGISIGVAHALGDHAEFEIGFDELGELLKASINK